MKKLAILLLFFSFVSNAQQSCEGRCYVLGCNQFVTKDMYPNDIAEVKDLEDNLIFCAGVAVLLLIRSGM